MWLDGSDEEQEEQQGSAVTRNYNAGHPCLVM